MRQFLLLTLLVGAAHAQEMQIDRQKARALHERAARGETLTADEQKYYEEAKRQRGRGGPPDSPQKPPAAPAQNLLPLTELAAPYQGQDGGLYGAGKNEPSPELAARAAQAAAQLRPLDADGKPAAGGKIVLMAIGMSNTTQEFSAFQRIADPDPRKASSVVVVDAAQGGKDARNWMRPAMETWNVAEERLKRAGVAPRQVQAVWIKQAIARPQAGWPAETDTLRELLGKIVAVAHEKYPNLRLVFLSSRTYAGYATTPLNPEPYAYESAFAVRALIRDQPADGPVLLWGPYLWTNGEKGRALDEFQWLKEDTAPDGTHPSRSGQEKVARLLLDFFTSNPAAKPWFTKEP